MTSDVRATWVRVETVHAVTYFADECRSAPRACGLRGFWMGYFGCRAAPMGPATVDDVVDAFYNFSPVMVARSIPDAWTFATPEVLVEARARAAANALRTVTPAIDAIAERAASLLDQVRMPVDSGLPLYSANRTVPLPDDPVARLWQQCTTVREHRGDSHVAALRASALDACESLVLFAADAGIPDNVFSENRGWTEQEWSDAVRRLQARGLLDAHGRATTDGRLARADVEAATDAATDALLGTAAAALADVLTSAATAIARSGVIPYPNPIGLPAVHSS